jgi:hypothetical protein
MSIVSRSLLATAVAVAMSWNIPAHALSLRECSVKYRAAQAAETLNGMSRKDPQKVECGAGAAAAPTSTFTKAATAPAAAPTSETAEPPKSTRIYNAAATGGPVFPTAVSPKYAGQSAGRARMLTCLDQYEANKADNLNGGLRWIQKGGGYYSMCNRHLKGAGA